MLNREIKKPVNRVSPFVIQKAIEGIACVTKDVKSVEPRDPEQTLYLLIECEKKAHSQNLRQAEMCGDVPVKVTPHRTLSD